MPGRHEFEYAVIRLVPKVEREEFINVGVILYCRTLRFLKTRFLLDKQKLDALGCHTDIPEIEANLQAFARICEGAADSGPIGELSPGERFRWLTATRSTMLQSSRVHPGLCTDAECTLDQLFRTMVQ